MFFFGLPGLGPPRGAAVFVAALWRSVSRSVDGTWAVGMGG